MSAALELQSAVVARLSRSQGLLGTYYDAPSRAPFPYAVVICSNEKDWSCKAREGREITLQVTLWDDQPSRLLTVESEAEATMDTVEITSAWCLSTLVLTGKRRLRDPARPWSCMLEYRARLLKTTAGAGA